MKTTVEIPDSLFQVITVRAEQRGEDFDTALTEVLRRGIEEPSMAGEKPAEPVPKQVLPTPSRPIMKTHPVTGLPYLDCSQLPPPEEKLSPDRVAEVLLQQEVEWQHEASRQ